MKGKKVAFESVPIVDQPPTLAELKKMIRLKGDLKKVFNIHGILYREMGIAKKIDTLTEEQALKLLSNNGKLIKRPFVLGEDFGLLGFKEKEWQEKF